MCDKMTFTEQPIVTGLKRSLHLIFTLKKKVCLKQSLVHKQHFLTSLDTDLVCIINLKGLVNTCFIKSIMACYYDDICSFSVLMSVIVTAFINEL